ncbi:MAG: hypothetical protein PHY05_14330 [Methanothrix sp.]|nr:hypothetical protein [Methanothrix sp.]
MKLLRKRYQDFFVGLIAEVVLTHAPRIREPARAHAGGQETLWANFTCRRSNGEGRQEVGAARGFRMEFAEEVQGPVAVGDASRFSIGVFTGVV